MEEHVLLNKSAGNKVSTPSTVLPAFKNSVGKSLKVKVRFTFLKLLLHNMFFKRLDLSFSAIYRF